MWAVLADSHLRRNKVRRNLKSPVQRRPRRRVAHRRWPGRIGVYVSESQVAFSEPHEPRQASNGSRVTSILEPTSLRAAC